MTPTEYQRLAARTAKPLSTRDEWLHYSLGLTGEAGEVAELIKKKIFYNKLTDPERIAEELGDCMWMIAMLSTTLGVSLESVMQRNIDKLLTRYPNGFRPPTEEG